MWMWLLFSIIFSIPLLILAAALHVNVRRGYVVLAIAVILLILSLVLPVQDYRSSMVANEDGELHFDATFGGSDLFLLESMRDKWVDKDDFYDYLLGN